MSTPRFVQCDRAFLQRGKLTGPDVATSNTGVRQRYRCDVVEVATPDARRPDRGVPEIRSCCREPQTGRHWRSRGRRESWVRSIPSHRPADVAHLGRTLRRCPRDTRPRRPPPLARSRDRRRRPPRGSARTRRHPAYAALSKRQPRTWAAPYAKAADFGGLLFLRQRCGLVRLREAPTRDCEISGRRGTRIA